MHLMFASRPAHRTIAARAPAGTARTFNPKINCSPVFDLATAMFINKREDVLFLGPGGTGKSHLAQAIGHCAIQQGYQVLYRETHVLLDELADAVADGTRSEYMASVATVPLQIIDDLGMRKLPHSAAEDLLEIIMHRYERFSTLLTSNRPGEDWGKLLGDVAAVSAMARSPPASRPRAQVRPAQLAHACVAGPSVQVKSV
jgi:DNA replication protein DnaC